GPARTDGRRPDVTSKSWSSFEVVLTGAFLTGAPLQVPVGEVNRLQQQIGTALMREPGDGWSFEPLAVQDAGGSYDGAGGYPSLVPLVLVKRDGAKLQNALQGALDALNESSHRWLQDQMLGWRWNIREVSIDVYDLGVGVFRCAVHFEPPKGMTAIAVRDKIDRLSRTKASPVDGVEIPLATVLEVLTRQTVEQFSAVVGDQCADLIETPWLQPMIDAIGRLDATGSSVRTSAHDYRWGKLLWLHPVVVFEAPTRAHHDEALAIAEPFRSDFFRSMDTRYGLFVPGIEISVIVGRNLSRSRETMLFWISMNWAYYALFMEIDRGLFARLDAAARGNGGASIPALEREAEESFAYYLRVERVKTRLQSMLMDMGGGALTLWETVTEGVRLEELIQAVNAKLALLQSLSERRLQEATAARDKRISTALFLLSAMTAVTVVTAIIGAVMGSPTFTHSYLGVRLAAIGVGLMMALVFFFIGSQWRLTRKSKFRSSNLR
ncbi:MAG: hypothetical protein ABIP57_02870, partial [Jatrophihabitantaceae bacterium]